MYPFTGQSDVGLGVFDAVTNGDEVSINFYPDASQTTLIEVQSFNQILYTASDFDNSPPDLIYGTVSQKLFLTTFDGASGLRANKKDFDLKHNGIPIYSKSFNPTDSTVLNLGTGVFTIPDHFFNTNEELVYTPTSTFIGVGASAVSIGATANSAGVVTTILPSTVFAERIDQNQFKLFTRPEYVSSGAAVTFTGTGSGNLHKLAMA